MNTFALHRETPSRALAKFAFITDLQAVQGHDFCTLLCSDLLPNRWLKKWKGRRAFHAPVGHSSLQMLQCFN